MKNDTWVDKFRVRYGSAWHVFCYSSQLGVVSRKKSEFVEMTENRYGEYGKEDILCYQISRSDGSI
jgi:hypothetical protein